MSDNDIQVTADDNQEELQPTLTAGYKPGERKTLEELSKMDAQDESLKKWKESLGLKVENPNSGNDSGSNVIIISMAMEVSDREDVVLDLTSSQSIEALKSNPMTIKEGVEYRLKVKFHVNSDVVSGLKYLHVVKRKGIRVDKMEEMLGSYGPASTPYEKTFLPEEAPSGMLARGTYDVKSKFTDDDGVTHLEFCWSFSIKKDWGDKE